MNALIQLFQVYLLEKFDRENISAKKYHICSEEMSSFATSTNKRNLRRQRSNCAISFFSGGQTQ